MDGLLNFRFHVHCLLVKGLSDPLPVDLGGSTRDNTERLLLMNLDTVESYKTEIWDFKTRMYISHVNFLRLITKVKNEHSCN